MQPVAGMRTGHQQRHAQRGQVVRCQRFDQPQAEVRAHAGTQYLGRPQQRGALERRHLRKAEGGRAAQDRADVAGVLQPVQHHRGRVGQQGRRGRQVEHESQRRGRRQLAHAGQQGVVDHYVFYSYLRNVGAGLRPKRCRKHRQCRAQAARQRRAAQVLALDPDAALLAVRAAILRQPAQVLQQRVVARADAQRPFGAHVHSVCTRSPATGAKLRRWCSQAPCACSAARCAAVP